MCVSAAVLILFSGGICAGFNVDTESPYFFNGTSGSYFGYTVALNRNSKGPVLLVGAPKANSTILQETIFEPGALFHCEIKSSVPDGSCAEVALMKKGNRRILNGTDFSYFDRMDGMWLGVSLDVRQSVTEKDVVVCGHLWKNKLYTSTYYVNGVCYVINDELNENSVKKLLPLIQGGEQYTSKTGSTEYHFAFGQAGISATFSEDTSNLVLGAPGILTWTGSIVDYSLYARGAAGRYNVFDVPIPPNEIEYDAYFGYSVSSGKFFDSRLLQYAVGAPRAYSNHGMVYIARGAGPRLYIMDRKRGFQLGEYFGAAVLGVDLNGDSFSELLVGAPLHSLESGGDEGKVYVYLSNGKDLLKQTEIAGDRKPRARFGSAIANIGDINQDNYLDVAVGAPYEEDSGAVYIYHGSENGLYSRYVQKIKASTFDRQLSGFGIHISRGLDVDDNGYPDILVGSYLSANAVLFRSRPVIYVYPSLTFIPRQIVMDVPCEDSLLTLTCVQLRTCLYYKGKHAPPSLEFKFSVFIQDRSYRGFFEQGTSREVNATTTLSVNIRIAKCFDFRMFLRPGVKDVLTPISVLFSHELKPPALSYNKTFPVYHPDSMTSITSQVPFQTGCGKADDCQSSLYVEVTRRDPPESMESMILGKVRNVTVDVEVGNEGEPAYMTELHICIPPSLSTISDDTCERGGPQNNASLVCDIGNPLRNDTKRHFTIKLDTTKIPPNTTYLALKFKVITFSTDTDSFNDVATLPLSFETVYDIGVTGTSSPDQLMYNGTEKSSIIMSHTYVVRNHGPSPLQTINFFLDVPKDLSTSDGYKQIVIFTGLDTEQRTIASVPVSCNLTSLEITVQKTQKQGGKLEDEALLTVEEVQTFNASSSRKTIGKPMDLKSDSVEAVQNTDSAQSKQVSKEDAKASETPIVRISCDNKDIRCVKLQCTASSFSNPRKYAKISLSFQVNYTILDKYLGSWDHLQLITNSSIKVKDNEVMKINIHPDTAELKTDILREGPPPPQKLKSWIIFVGIGVGVFLLILILILLIKVDFFRRKERDDMKKLIRESTRVKKKEDEVIIKEDTDIEVVE